MKREKKSNQFDIQVCPRCFSPKIQRVSTMEGDMAGHIALSPPKYKCLACDWRGRLVLMKRVNKEKDI